AVKQLAGTGIELHKMRVPEQIPIPQWLASRGFAEPVIAVDGLCQTVGAMETLRQAFDVPVSIVSVPDLLSPLWTDRPAIPSTPIITLGEDLTGESRDAKVHWLRKWMIMQGVDACFLTALDEIAWLLNVRGSDVEYNPVVISYLLVTMDRVYWFVRKNAYEVPDEETQASFDELAADEVTICDYEEAVLALSTYVHNEVDRIYVDPGTLNIHIREALKEGDYDVVEGLSPIPLKKSVKNPVEIEGMREAHLEDGLAVEKFLYWLEGQAGLVGALPAVSLVGETSLITAFANDVTPTLVFAQQIFGLGRRGDVLLAISTSGNSDNVLFAVEVAKIIGLKVVAMTGRRGGRLRHLSDVAVCVPADMSHTIQEFHLPIYHMLCLAAENEFFGE
ncbi:MAG: aminopeptidase P family N-terminal domain-containing protein, partial [Quinella sp. 1Q7]|nr:aminopeptidase P family N-terminal domain-containing protein [Quinella sp. 1Q7]